MKKDINFNKVVVFTGAGVSAESGLKTYRDIDGLWYNHNINDVATKAAFKRDPEAVINFWNYLKGEISAAEPNEAHKAIAKLEAKYEVVVITTNVDDLHERAGSSHVIHIHGDITKARSPIDPDLKYDLGPEGIEFGKLCDMGGQLRPDVVLFDEAVPGVTEARAQLKDAGKVLIIGSSLSVAPACNIFKAVRGRAEKKLVGFKVKKLPFGFTMYREKATEAVPRIINKWLRDK
ncbi:Sir2 family NAD-dependent protein deacetylase [Vibrio owensii]|uniref:Sir2 family NAD-dependent protein deacetylase n=1 Tax=Vibrio owensii TaxID=696485 RepID=UPI003CC554A8